MRPDKQLGGLLGLTDAGSTLSNGYILVDNATQAGPASSGRRSSTTGPPIATPSTERRASQPFTPPPRRRHRTLPCRCERLAPTEGQAAAFTYDLARSIVLTRQGNPAWVGQDRDGVFPIRPNDLFYGAAAGDVQPDWVNTAKLADPAGGRAAATAGESHRDDGPGPEAGSRFWYLPRGEKAAIVMTGDDHAVGGTAGRFDQYKAASAPGCVVSSGSASARRRTSIPPGRSPTRRPAGTSPTGSKSRSTGRRQVRPAATTGRRPASQSVLDQPALGVRTKYTGVPAPKTQRVHCVTWTDWSTLPKTELATESASTRTTTIIRPPGSVRSRAT